MRAAASVTISKNVAEAFTEFASLENRPKYIRSITELKVTSKEWAGKGVSWHESRFEDNNVKKGTVVIDQYRPPRLLVLKVHSMGLRYKVRFNFQPESQTSTKIIATIGGQQAGILGKIMNGFLSQNTAYVHDVLQQELDGFKAFIEASNKEHSS